MSWMSELDAFGQDARARGATRFTSLQEWLLSCTGEYSEVVSTWLMNSAEQAESAARLLSCQPASSGSPDAGTLPVFTDDDLASIQEALYFRADAILKESRSRT
jgi:hypothetical protein